MATATARFSSTTGEGDISANLPYSWAMRCQSVVATSGARASQADGLAAELRPEQTVAAGGRIALVEDEIDDGQDGGQPVGQDVVGRDGEGNAGHLDLPLGPHQPLGQRGLRDQEGASDL